MRTTFIKGSSLIQSWRKTEICTIIFGHRGHLQRNESFGPEAVRVSEEAGALRCSPVRHGNLSR